jgi:hypothetical protein
MRVNVRVQSNLGGEVNGVKIEHLHAPVISDNLFNTQLYVWHGDPTEKAWEELLDEAARPYKYLEPYKVSEKQLFFGRDGETDLLTARIMDQRLVLLHGQQGVGKTSLMNAGVIPSLLEKGMMVLSMDNYIQPVESLRRDLAVYQDQLELGLGAFETFSELLINISRVINGSMTLVLDHFERVYTDQFDLQMRENLLNDLSFALEKIKPELLRVVFVVDQNKFDTLSDNLENHFPGLLNDHFKLGPLSLDRARRAILYPFLKKPEKATYQNIRYSDTLLKVLIDDLDILPDKPEWSKMIYPQHLEIVCSELYQEAITAGKEELGEEFYDEIGGAQGILLTHFRGRLKQALGETYDDAEQLLMRMTMPGMPDWVSVEEVSRNGTAQDTKVMENLVQAGYLRRRSPNGHPEYAFPSDSAAAVVETLDEAKMANRRRAHEVLELAWNLWVKGHEPATRGQLRFLADYGDHLEPRLDRALFLLYSALAKSEPAAGPYAWLQGAPHSKELIKHFEDPDREPLPGEIAHAIEHEARKLLGLHGLTTPDWSMDPHLSCGPLAYAAVHAEDEISAKTATLALMWGYDSDGWGHVKRAIGRLEDSRRAARLRAARQGLLIEELPDYSEDITSDGEIRRIWWWRFRRRLRRSASGLGWMAAGAALGAGLLTGLMRLVIAIPAVSDIAGISFAIQAYWNAILATGAALGALLASPLLLDGKASKKELPRILKPFASSESGEMRLSVLLGALGFALFFLVAAVFNGVNFAARPLLLLTAPVAGLGVALGLAGQPGAGRPQGKVAWARRLIPGGLGFVLSQVAAQIAGLSGAGTITNKAPKYYIDEFSYLPPLQRLFENAEWVPIVLSLLDAAAIGALLTAGMILGIHVARGWRARWNTFVRYTED